MRPEDIDGGQQLTENHDQVSLEAKQNSTQDWQESKQELAQDWSPDWDQVMAQYMATEHGTWSDEDDVMNAWALRVPLGNMFDDCPVFE